MEKLSHIELIVSTAGDTKALKSPSLTACEVADTSESEVVSSLLEFSVDVMVAMLREGGEGASVSHTLPTFSISAQPLTGWLLYVGKPVKDSSSPCRPLCIRFRTDSKHFCCCLKLASCSWSVSPAVRSIVLHSDDSELSSPSLCSSVSLLAPSSFAACGA